MSRQQKLQLFARLMQPTPAMRVLDLGGETNPGGDRTLQFIDTYAWRDKITAVNLSSAHIATIQSHYPEIDARVGDARQLPWPDKYFDVVYSNAVIEHVGDFERQRQMAKEVMRVGKRWFVTTPNRWYPYEFHLRLPLVTWLPGSLYLSAARMVQYNHVKRCYQFGNAKPTGLRLLDGRQMRTLFPQSRIIKQRVTFWPETLIAVGGDGVY